MKILKKTNPVHADSSVHSGHTIHSGSSACFDSGICSIRLEHVSKSYGSEHVLKSLSLSLEHGKTYCLMAPSGSGKTTLFRILMGLESMDSGRIYGLESCLIASVFQEDRLLEGYTALDNIRFVTGKQYSVDELTRIMTRLLPADALVKPVCEFSGGMKRRTAILRAILAPSDFIIMDEPFTGLDEETKLRTMELIRQYTNGKLLLFSTHNEEDAKLLSAEIIHLI